MSLILRNAYRPSSFSICSVCSHRWALSGARYSSTEAIPPLIAKMKGELKTAMKAKDTPRLNVLRAIISDYNNASKTATPIVSDMQILAQLRKRKASSEEAVKEALSMNREDIAAKQRAEISIMDEYAGSVETMTGDEIKAAVQGVIDQIKSAGGDTKAGQILKEIFKPDGIFEGKPVEKSQVAKLVNSILKGQ